MRDQLNGMTCDAQHPFPAPPSGAWQNSLDFGAASQRSAIGPYSTDVNPSPIWRAIAASIWDAPCREKHELEISEEEGTVLTTYLLAAAMRSSKSPTAMTGLSISFVNSSRAVDALNRSDFRAADDEIQEMLPKTRHQLVKECIALILIGFTNLQADLLGEYLRRQPPANDA
ncbi:hypothetical protein [Actinoplanes sp. HUAS TT8]|uniref:hypothetical protein n=1 Tax=Actinoplanes sp. HUAS TT8 TaxID=3447453 RepID=UPI003F51EB58